jgi:hypothetical protein
MIQYPVLSGLRCNNFDRVMNFKKNPKIMSDEYPGKYVFILIIIAIVIFGAIILYALNKPSGVVSDGQNVPDVCKEGQNCVQQVTPDFSKGNLTDAQKKISTDLLQLIGIFSLPSGLTQNAFEQQMIQAGQIKWVDNTGAITNDTKTGRKVVNVYIKTTNNPPQYLLNPYIWNVSNADPANALIVAWVEPDNLLKLASLDTVQSIRTIMPPVNN